MHHTSTHSAFAATPPPPACSYFEQTACCRWARLLGCFSETAGFNACERCDVCEARKEHVGDVERDFGAEARVLLTAISTAGSKAWTYIEKDIKDPRTCSPPPLPPALSPPPLRPLPLP